MTLNIIRFNLHHRRQFYNETDTLAIALHELPISMEGFDKIEWLVINDGSTDNTVKNKQM
jgi:glycosyltransferase involved in cell wall biosynthesis